MGRGVRLILLPQPAGIVNPGGGGGGGGEPPTPFDPATLTNRSQAFATRFTLGEETTTEAGTSATPMIALTDVRNVRVAYGNRVGAGPAGTITLKLALFTAGQTYPITWAGSPTVEIPEGISTHSDAVDVVIRKGQKVWMLSYQQAGQLGPARFTTAKAGYLTGDQTGDGTAFYLGASAKCGQVSWAYGDTVPGTLSLVGLGDSIAEQDYLTTACVAAGVPFANIAQWAQGTPGGNGMVDSPKWAGDHRLPARVAVTEYGANTAALSLGYPNPLATFAGVQLNHWQGLADEGLIVAGCTMFPRSHSTDGWATLGGQSEYTAGGIYPAGYAALLTGYNAWIRDGAPIVGGVPAPGTVDPSAIRKGDPGHPLQAPTFDLAATCQDPTNPWRWRIDHPAGLLTGDGTHLSAAGITAMSAAAADWLGVLASALN